MDKIKVMIVDDHAIVREGLSSILAFEDDIEVVGEAVNGVDAIEAFQKLNPHLVLMDLQMPGMDGVQSIKKIKQINPEVKIIILTVFQDEEYVYEGIKAGARGYLLKDTSPDELVETIRKVNRGESLIEPFLATKVLDKFSELAKHEKPEHNLTPRELQIITLLSEGKSNKELAQDLYISEKTVKTHITHIFEKLNVRDRTEAVMRALKKGIIQI
ncbi:response regulator transcription factor [candidate division KSB1 bacterium]|nr:response regulator transcription factor [candidate division KSB1 bacterium]